MPSPEPDDEPPDEPLDEPLDDVPPDDEPPAMAPSLPSAEPSSATAASPTVGAAPASCAAEDRPNAGSGNVQAFVPLKVTPVTTVAPAKQSCTSKQLGLLALPLEPNTRLSS